MYEIGLTVKTKLPNLVDQFGKKSNRFSAEGWKTCNEGAASREREIGGVM